jgi:putative membrane protein
MKPLPGLTMLAGLAFSQLSHAANLSANDVKYLNKSAQGLMSELKLGNLAQQRGSDERVRNFGKQMVTDHGKDLQQLQQLAAQKKIQLPETMNDDQRKEAEKLSKLSGKEFDKEYLRYEAKDHSEDIKEQGKEMKKTLDPDLKKFSGAEYETVTQHKQTVDTLRALVK